MWSAVAFVTRIVLAVLSQPGTQDIISSAAKRVIESGTRQVIRSIINRSSTRRTVDTFR